VPEAAHQERPVPAALEAEVRVLALDLAEPDEPVAAAQCLGERDVLAVVERGERRVQLNRAPREAGAVLRLPDLDLLARGERLDQERALTITLVLAEVRAVRRYKPRAAARAGDPRRRGRLRRLVVRWRLLLGPRLLPLRPARRAGLPALGVREARRRPQLC